MDQRTIAVSQGLSIPYSLVLVLVPIHCFCDPNHGEHKFPHFRGVIA